ncbi:DNA (cytosine-5-)-methyltransferase [Alloprevotella sp. Lung230]|uniref:DNA (cytosine-5-)-methyltransferase n=1 Tax=Alloprevotella sp. Lung230 TaxID=2766595 RepID=UPI0016550CCC|nr:DNA (cytosine-5-)-methyltransferase [Alloprevotella sp. Lung230]MBC8626714.1 DNA (cytosine-5-)-methyltransferase [Alloprevotella sp. Lung230]
MIRLIDLFAGMSGIRCGVEQAAAELGISTQCVFTSEIKPHALKVLQQNHPGEQIFGDITKIAAADIPDFDILLGGFPCQAFSSAGKRMGFADTRGTLFFDVERIIKEKRPLGFLLENVEGLENHDKGNTLRTILSNLRALGYKVSYAILNAAQFGVPQERKRIYIVGTLTREVPLVGFHRSHTTLGDILEQGKPTSQSAFVQRLLERYPIPELYGKAIKDKRGGDDNIHSWDLELKGAVSPRQKQLLNAMLRERRKKKWAAEIGIEWMDGMPLTEKQIATFFPDEHLPSMLNDLAEKGYLKLEHPKQKVLTTHQGDIQSAHRVPDPSLPKGYNIVAGKLSFEVSKVLGPHDVAPTLVAMDMQKLYVADKGGLRRFTLREGLRLFGYPETYQFDLPEKEAFDLLGNTVVVPVIKQVALKLLQNILTP